MKKIYSNTKTNRLATKLPPPNNQLFMRLLENHLAKSMDVFTIYTSL
jgi:hypothetical protein